MRYRLQSASPISFNPRSRASSASRASSNGRTRSSTTSATAFSALVERDALLLADDMGLGKTIQTAAALRILFRLATDRVRSTGRAREPRSSSGAARFANGRPSFERARSGARLQNARSSGKRRHTSTSRATRHFAPTSRRTPTRRRDGVCGTSSSSTRRRRSRTATPRSAGLQTATARAAPGP